MAAKPETPSPEDLGLEAVNVQTESIETPSPGTNQPDEPRRRRGRPAGSGTKTEGAKKTNSRKAADLDAFAKQVQGIHQMLAMMTGFGEVALSDVESKMLATSLNAMSEEYGLSLDGKTGAAIQLLGTAAVIYLPRAMVIRAKVAAAAEARAAQDATPVN